MFKRFIKWLNNKLNPSPQTLIEPQTIIKTVYKTEHNVVDGKKNKPFGLYCRLGDSPNNDRTEWKGVWYLSGAYRTVRAAQDAMRDLIKSKNYEHTKLLICHNHYAQDGVLTDEMKAQTPPIFSYWYVHADKLFSESPDDMKYDGKLNV